jgi:hypothetical protein
MASKVSTNKAFIEFKSLVIEEGWSPAQLRCDVPPTPELLEAMGRFGLEDWERYVLRLERERAQDTGQEVG